MSGSMATRLSGKDRALALFEAWRKAGPDTDIEMRIGRSGEGEPAVFISIGPADMHGFTVSEARTVEKVLTSTLSKYPENGHQEGLDKLLSALQYTMTAAESQP